MNEPIRPFIFVPFLVGDFPWDQSTRRKLWCDYTSACKNQLHLFLGGETEVVKLHSRSIVREENARARIRILLTYFSRLLRAQVKPQKATLMTFLFMPRSRKRRRAASSWPRKNSFVSPRGEQLRRLHSPRSEEGRSADCFFTTMLSNRGGNFCLATSSVRHRTGVPRNSQVYEYVQAKFHCGIWQLSRFRLRAVS